MTIVREVGMIRGVSSLVGRTRFALSVGGFVFFAVLVITGIGLGKFTIPGGDVTDIYLRAGELLRPGRTPISGVG